MVTLHGAKSLLARRHLIWALAKREIQDRYVGSYVGVAWSVLQPLAIVLILAVAISGFSFRKSEGYLNLATTMICFLSWYTVSQTISAAVGSIRLNRNFLSQVDFPVEVIPVKSVVATLVVQTVVLFIVVACGIAVGSISPISAPLLMFCVLVQIPLCLGLGWSVACMGLYFRDLEQALPTILMMNIYLLPIFYTLTTAPEPIKVIVALNPFSPMVESFRMASNGIPLTSAWPFWIYLGGSIAVCVLGWRLFKSLKDGFADCN